MKIILTWLLAYYWMQVHPTEASSQCGVRGPLFTPRMYRGWPAEEGQWPWHVALFNKAKQNSPTYICGGTLLDQKHVLTSAHCVVNRKTHRPLSVNMLELHFGQHNIRHQENYVQVSEISKIYVHPENSTNQNDIAMLVVKLPVEYTDFVSPICLEQQMDWNSQNLKGKRGWVAGWGTTGSGAISDVLQTASMPVVSELECCHNNQGLSGILLRQNVFCAGDGNGTSPGKGDSGGGMYFSEGDTWVLRGIVSMAKANAMNEIDTSGFTVFVNIQPFLTWIKQIMAGNISQTDENSKRKSEKECDRFERFVNKQYIGCCASRKYSHNVSLSYPDAKGKCNGVLINENHVLTVCSCIRKTKNQKPSQVQIDGYGILGIFNITCHPEYQKEFSINDLAIVKLRTIVRPSSKIIPACLANNWTENLYGRLIQTGNGESWFSDTNTFIHSRKNRIIDEDQCKNLSSTAIIAPSGVKHDQFCVISSDRSKINNKVFSGTPLQYFDSNTGMYTIVGMTSSSYFGPNLTAIEVYTRVSDHLDWIEKIVWNVPPPLGALF